jgi:glycosyltransferase involved in cell wall biosynthesis
MEGKANLAVIILTYNEAIHLPRALQHIQEIAREIFVIDSGSKDGTVEIAKAAGAQVLYHPFQNQAKQFQWALDNARVTAEWVMRLDADEVIETDLAREIVEKLPTLPPDVTGINLNRKTIFQGQWIRWGGRYPLILLRIWRRGSARIEDRWMDEHIYLAQGRAVNFKGGFADDNLNDLTFFTEKHNGYASREALDVLNKRMHLFGPAVELTHESAAIQTRIKRFLKEKIYNRIPFELAVTGYLFLRYVLQLGFLDGRAGITYHVLQCGWYRFLVGAKLRELEHAVKQAETPEEVHAIIERLTRRKLKIQ